MSVIDEVKSRTDIVDLVSEQVALQRAGRNFKALCPFHSEKTPSFSISPDRQTWHCFGACGDGGDVFNFVMKRENVEFGEALRLLAQRAGIALEERRDPQEDERHQRLLEANEAAAAFFHHALGHAQHAESARAYLTTRGLDPETIETFQLGHSPDGWDALKSHLVGRGFSEADLLEAGLLVEGDRGPYDRFRNRLMFPIRDDRGRVAGFGGRALEASANEQAGPAGAKYLNTPQTPIFDKGGLLYAFDRAKESIRREKTVIVVEGYMDAIAAHQHGASNVVASMGTALTERQIRTLERLKPKVLLALDADAAGVEATLRALQEGQSVGAVGAAAASAHPGDMSEEEFAAKSQEWSRNALKRAAVTFYVVPLSGKDPDEMIRADRSAWDDAVNNATPFTDHVFDTVAHRRDLSQPAERSELLRELLPVVRLIEEPVYRAHYVQRLARLCRLDEAAIRTELRRKETRVKRPTGDQTATPAAPPTRRDPAEEFCLALLFRYPELRGDGAALSPELFMQGEHRALFTAWLDAPDPKSIEGALPQELGPLLEHILGRNMPGYGGQQALTALQDCVRRIEFRRLSTAKRAGAAALTDPGVQQELNAAVEEARAVWESGPSDAEEGTPPAQPGSRTHELAVALVEDMEAGRRLHQRLRDAHDAPASGRSGQTEDSA